LLMCLSLRRFAQSIGLFVLLICCSSSLYPYLYRIWETLRTSRYINLSCLKLWFFTIDLLPDLIIVLWRTNFKSIPFETEQRLHQYYSILVLMWRQVVEMVVAEACTELVVVHCTLSTLVKWLLMRCFR